MSWIRQGRGSEDLGPGDLDQLIDHRSRPAERSRTTRITAVRLCFEMGPEGEEFLQHDVVVGEHLLIAPHRCHQIQSLDGPVGRRLALVGHVSNGGRDHRCVRYRGQLNVYGNTSAIGVLGLDVEVGASHSAWNRVGSVCLAVVAVLCSPSRRHQRVDRLAGEFGWFVAEQLTEGAIGKHDRSVAVHDCEPIGNQVNHAAEQRIGNRWWCNSHGWYRPPLSGHAVQDC